MRGDGTSGRWRIELADDGAAAVAFALPDAPHARGGRVGWQGDPGETVLDAHVELPLRRDFVELAVLTALEIACARIGADQGPVDVRVELVLPSSPVPPRHRSPTGLTMHAVDGPRDPDLPDDPPARVPGSRDVPLGPFTPAETAVPAADLRDAPALVVAARDLALGLLEQVGVEDTAVLGDRTLVPRAAAAVDQQLVHEHARALGLPVDELSPADLRDRAEDLRSQARRLIKPPSG